MSGPEPTTPIKGDETILLVEDDEAVRDFAEAVLCSYGYNVLTASSGHAAIGIFESHHGNIDLVLTDVIMPEMSGPMLAQLLRSRKADQKVVFMSGYTEETICLHGVDPSGEAFVQKPFSPRSLAEKVRTVIDQGSGRASSR